MAGVPRCSCSHMPCEEACVLLDILFPIQKKAKYRTEEMLDAI